MKVKKPKQVNFSLIEEQPQSEPYRVLREARQRFHPDLAEAEIALAWRKNTKADVDGHLVLGRCVKVSELQKEFAAFDFIIVLNKEVWEDQDFTPEKKLALVDHELCHAAPALDSDLERKQDERGRYLWRTRRHDIEEFQSVVANHGCYKRDLERFAETILKRQSAPLFAEQPKGKSKRGEKPPDVRLEPKGAREEARAVSH